MITDELKRNLKRNLEGTLRDLSSFDEQRRYKSSVPFVHVPIELLEQWADHRRMLRELSWYQAMYSSPERAAFAKLDEVIVANARRFRTRDVPEVFQDAAWEEVGRLAREVLEAMRKQR